MRPPSAAGLAVFLFASAAEPGRLPAQVVGAEAWTEALSGVLATFEVLEAAAPVAALPAAGVEGSTGAPHGRLLPFEPHGGSTSTVALLREAGRQGFVEVRFYLAPYDPASGRPKERYWKHRDAWGLEEKAQNRIPLSFAGARAPGPGLAAAKLFDFDLDHLEGFEIVDSSGAVFPAKPVGLATTGSMVWVQADALKDAPLPPLSAVGGLTQGRTARLDLHDGVRIRRGSFGFEHQREADEDGFRRSSSAVSGPGETLVEDAEMVFDASGTWRGWLGNSWRSRRVLSPTDERDAMMTLEELASRRRRAEKAVEGLVIGARLVFREDDTGEAGSFTNDEARLEEREDWGVPAAKGLIFVPHPLSPGLVRRLERIELTIGGKPVQGKFAGILGRSVSGYLVASAAVPAPAAPPPPPEDGRLALAVETRLVDGRPRAHAFPDRVEGPGSGQQGGARPKPRFLSDRGGIVADLDGRPSALMVEEPRPELVVDRSAFHSPRALVVLRPLAELHRLFADPAAVVDARFQPVPPKQRPWLGVLTQDIHPNLAKLLRASEATRGGTLGQLINEVIPGSPAERAGLRPGDIVVRVRPEGKRQDVEVPAASPAYIQRHGRDTLFDLLRAPTALDKVLSESAPGTRVILTVARDGAEAASDAELAPNPMDAVTAPKSLDKSSGLTVKELTDDVRRFLRLKAGLKALLVYAVEPGSPAAVADLTPLTLVLEADGKPVSTPLAFAAHLASRRNAREASVRLKVELLGLGRYADLRVAAEPSDGRR